MAWIGKLGGGVLGYLAAGPVGAVVGLALGHQFDRGTSLGPRPAQRSQRPGGAGSFASRQKAFFETTFLVMGHLAKAEGRVSEAEIAAARRAMAEMRLRPEEVRRAIELFRLGKRRDYPLMQQVEVLRGICRGSPELLMAFIEIQLDFVLFKGSILPRERELLWQIGDRLGIGRVDMARLEAVLRARRTFGQRRTSMGGPDDALERAYRALGVSATASDEQIKTAYRRLMNQHHPDKQAAHGLPEAQLEAAKERTREIRAAYDTIRERRGTR